MTPFRYLRTRQGDDPVALLSTAGNGAFIAGGTTLVDLMKLGVENPSTLIDINSQPLAHIEDLADGGLRIGALARNSDVAHHVLVRKRYPMLSEALLSGASPQLRNMATVGGNIMQRTRCYYFRDLSFACNKRGPGSGCTAMESFNRIHAILGTSDQCVATNPSDMSVALVALDATLRLRGPNGERTVPFEQFHLVPGQTPYRETVLKPGELITAVDIPKSPIAAHSLYLKVRDRASYEFALASVALALEMSGGKIQSARVAFGGVATKPWRAHDVERVLTGQLASEDLFAKAARAAVEGAQPRRDNAFKVDLLQRTLIKGLRTLTALAVSGDGHRGGAQ